MKQRKEERKVSGGARKMIRSLTYSAIFLALAQVLPFLTGQIPQIGNMFCPMHYPVLLCGFVCGWPWGMAVGLIAPIMRSLIFGMPPLYPTAIAMAFELAAYGAVSGVFYRILPKKKWNVYVSLLIAMLAGRLVWGGAQYILLGMQGKQFSASAFYAGAVSQAIPGIILQIVLIPVIVMLLQKAGYICNRD